MKTKQQIKDRIIKIDKEYKAINRQKPNFIKDFIKGLKWVLDEQEQESQEHKQEITKLISQERDKRHQELNKLLFKQEKDEQQQADKNITKLFSNKNLKELEKEGIF